MARGALAALVSEVSVPEDLQGSQHLGFPHTNLIDHVRLLF